VWELQDSVATINMPTKLNERCQAAEEKKKCGSTMRFGFLSASCGWDSLALGYPIPSAGGWIQFHVVVDIICMEMGVVEREVGTESSL